MRNNIHAQIRASMDGLHFSQEAKDTMVDRLLEQAAQIEAEKKSHGKRKLLIVALAAATALVMFTGAAIYTRWSKTMQTKYQATQEQKELAENIGLSSMLETTGDGTEVISTTDQGVTITAVQSIVDKYSAMLTFRIDGFALPEGEEPCIEMYSAEVKGIHAISTPIFFYDGTTTNEKGEQVYGDGSSLQYSEDGSAILDYTAANGSLEFSLTLSCSDGNIPVGKEVSVHISTIGTKSKPNLVSGDWTLQWILSGTAETLVTTPRAVIGNTGVTLLQAEISPISVFALFKINNADGHIENNDSTRSSHEVFDTIEDLFAGIRLKNGTFYFIPDKTTGVSGLYSDAGVQHKHPEFADEVLSEKAVLFDYQRLIKRILDPEEVDAFLFLKSNPENKELWELTEENFYIVPIR